MEAQRGWSRGRHEPWLAPSPRGSRAHAPGGWRSANALGLHVLQAGEQPALRQGPWSSVAGACVARAARAVGSPERQLSLALVGLRECPGPAGRGHVQGEGTPGPRLGFERKGGEAGVGCRLVLLQWRKTHEAEAGRLSARASREVFLQAAPRRGLLQREASALWEDGGVAHLGMGRNKEERRHGERGRRGERRRGVRLRWARGSGGFGAGSSRAHRCPRASCCSGARRKGCRREKRRVCQRCRGRPSPAWPRRRRGPPAPGSPQRRGLRRSPPRLAGGRS